MNESDRNKHVMKSNRENVSARESSLRSSRRQTNFINHARRSNPTPKARKCCCLKPTSTKAQYIMVLFKQTPPMPKEEIIQKLR